MVYVLGIIGIVGSFFLIRYREMVGDMIGDADWMKYVGGNYNLVVIIAVIIFFWSLAEMTGTTYLLFAPLRFLIPGLNNSTLGGEAY